MTGISPGVGLGPSLSTHLFLSCSAPAGCVYICSGLSGVHIVLSRSATLFLARCSCQYSWSTFQRKVQALLARFEVSIQILLCLQMFRSRIPLGVFLFLLHPFVVKYCFGMLCVCAIVENLSKADLLKYYTSYQSGTEIFCVGFSLF